MQEDTRVIQEEGRKAIWMAFGVRKDYGESSLSAVIDTRVKGGGSSWKSASTKIHATESRNSGRSKPPVSSEQVLTGFVHRCLNELDPIKLNWVNFRYRREGVKREDCARLFMREFSAAYMANNMSGSRVGTRSIIREMVAWRMRQEVGGIPLSVEFKSINNTISRQQWHKTYKKHWGLICAGIMQIDGAAAYSVGVKLSG